MGNNNCCSRDNFDEQKERAKANLIKARDIAKYKFQEAKANYGPIIQEKYEEGKMKIQTLRPEIIKDDSQCSMITKFEQSFPLKTMTIDEYERRIKKLADPSSQDVISETQLIESFKDIYPEIETEGTLIKQLLLNPAFKTSEHGYSITELLLFGNLYCANTPHIRAQKFFEICQEDLPPTISNQDKELVKYFKLMAEIAYIHMINLYRVAKSPEDPPVPESFQALSDEDMQLAYDNLFEYYLDQTFKLNSRLSKEEFIELMRGSQKQWLQPHFLRQQVFQKIMDVMAQQYKKQ